MATTYNNCQMGIVDASGNLSVIYPQTKASLVSCDSGNYGGSSAVTDVQSALNNLSGVLGKVTQTPTTTNSNYEVLYSETANDTTRTEGARKTSRFTFNPYYGSLKILNNDSTKTCMTLSGNSNSTSTSPVSAFLNLGNSTTTGTAGNRYGILKLYSQNSGSVSLYATNTTKDYTQYLPAEGGTIALISNLFSWSKITGLNAQIPTGESPTGIATYTQLKNAHEAIIFFEDNSERGSSQIHIFNRNGSGRVGTATLPVPESHGFYTSYTFAIDFINGGVFGTCQSGSWGFVMKVVEIWYR